LTSAATCAAADRSSRDRVRPQLSRLYREAQDYSALQSRALLATIADGELDQASLSRLLDTFGTAAGQEALAPYRSMKEMLTDIGEMCSLNNSRVWTLREGLGGTDSIMYRLTLEGTGGRLGTIRGAVGPLVVARRVAEGDWSRIVAFGRKIDGVDLDVLYFDSVRGTINGAVHAEVKAVGQLPDDLSGFTKEFGGHIVLHGGEGPTAWLGYEMWFTQLDGLSAADKSRLKAALELSFARDEVRARFPTDDSMAGAIERFRAAFERPRFLRFGR
jgi:hypothetical protein